VLDRITSMQAFVRVATLGGFSAAARSLSLSQTMATKHVVALEERLGVKLFRRTTRSVTPTEAGRRYLESCERILAEIEDAEEAAVADHLELRGQLKLAVPVVFGTREIAPLLGDFARLHPAVTIDLGFNDRVVDLVDEGWDMAVRIGILKDSTLTARRLAPCHIVQCASPDYLARRGTPYRIADLASHDCLSYTLPGPAAAERWLLGENGEVSVPIQPKLKANNGDALRAAAVAGLGIISQPTFIVGDDIRAGRLVLLRLEHPPMRGLGVHAVMPPGRNPPAKVKAFAEFLALRFWPEPLWDRDLALG